MPEARHVGIVGGGVAGLATALHLLDRSRDGDRPLRVTVWEAAPAWGGHLRTVRDDGFTVEHGPNGFLDSEPATLRLVARLGLDGELLRSSDATRRRFILLDGRLREIPTGPASFLRSDLLTWRGKLRLLGEPLVRRRAGLGREAADPALDETVDRFGRRRLGDEFAERLLDPMVKGVFGGDARSLSLAAAFPRMVKLEREFGSLVRALVALSRRRRRATAPQPAGVLHTFRGGMARLPERLAAVLDADPRAILHPGHPVRAVTRDPDGGWRVATGDGRPAVRCDTVVLAVPAHAAAGLLADDPPLAAELAGIPYSPLAVVCLAWPRAAVRHPLDGFGFLVPGRERSPLLGALWSSSIFPDHAPRDHVLLRCMVGGPGHDALLERDDAELVATVATALRPLLGTGGRPARTWVFRHPRAIAQYRPGHLARLRRIDALLAERPGLVLAGSAYRGIAVNHCVAGAERTAAAVLANPSAGTATARRCAS